MGERAERCETCRFWELLPAGHQDRGEPLNGTCRRFPPVLDTARLVKQKYDEIVEDTFKGGGYVFPVTGSDDWCGEWRAADEEAS